MVLQLHCAVGELRSELSGLCCALWVLFCPLEIVLFCVMGLCCALCGLFSMLVVSYSVRYGVILCTRGVTLCARGFFFALRSYVLHWVSYFVRYGVIRGLEL